MRVAVVPKHDSVLSLLIRGKLLAQAGFAIAPRRRMLDLVMAYHRIEIHTQAAYALPYAAQFFSNRLGMTGSQMAFWGAFILLALIMTTIWPKAVFHTFSLSAFFSYFIMVSTRLAALFVLPKTPSSALLSRAAENIPESELPIYTVIVALYKESAIIPRLIRGLLALDYPKAKLDIIFVLEANDHETRDALTSLELPYCIQWIVAPPGYPRTKPRALNIALPLARGTYTVVYDAEDQPDPLQLRLAAAHFRHAPEKVVCLQAHLAIENRSDNWLTHLFAVEYTILFEILNPGLLRCGLPILLGGSSNHFRTAILRSVHGWDAWNVTEDADLAIRLIRYGYEMRDLPSITFEEAPISLSAWIFQRTRWMKGFVQVFITHSRFFWQPRTSHPYHFFFLLLMVVGTFTSAMGFPFFVISVLMRLSNPPLFFSSFDWFIHTASLMLFGAGATTVLLMGCVGTRKIKRPKNFDASEKHWTTSAYEYVLILLFPFYYALATWAAWRSLYEVMEAPFRWNKTAHGVTKTLAFLHPTLQKTEPPKAGVAMTSNDDVITDLNP
jgi:cellulose synthase/poly-beta-1,6-N-acetylglucosamine synthase-like glycosyltransferase